jgi:hypothetical protein
MSPELVLPLAPVLLGDVVVDDDENEGSYGPKGIKFSGAINGYPKFDVGYESLLMVWRRI